MRIAIIALGTLGDLRPYLALGRGLLRAGHQVTMITHAEYAPLVREQQLACVAIGGNPRAILDTPAGRAWVASGQNPFVYASRMLEVLGPWLRPMVAASKDACRGADLLVGSGLGFFVGYQVAEYLQVPIVPAYLQPITPTRAFPNAFVATTFTPRREANILTHYFYWHVVGVLGWQLFRGELNRVRRDLLGLAPLPRRLPYGGMYRHAPMLYGYSPAVLPRPLDWPSSVHVTGYWFLDRSDDWVPPVELDAFLRSGPPPICVGFGSMNHHDPGAATALVVRALELTGQRCVLLTGWGALQSTRLPPTVFQIEAVPHDWLFPRVAAVVHHGGAGTTAACLRAGVPAIVTPFFGDQLFWGRIISQRGAGTPPILREQLSAERLAQAIRLAIDDEGMRALTSLIGAQIQAEDGVARAIEALTVAYGRGSEGVPTP